MTATAPDRPVAAPAAAPLGDEMIRLEDATVRFGDVLGIGGISLSVPRGTILGIIGPSGAGKTTTVRVLTGGLPLTSGSARVLGQDPRRFRRRTRERIGYMPQQFTLYPDLTAGENVDFVASLFGLLWFRRRRRVKEVLHVVDLWDARGRRAGNLSGGMQRRLELASALVHDPDLLFLDEPTAGIDPLLRARIWDELHRLKAAGRTLLVTTQYVNEAEECDLVALIAQGRLAALATPDELRREATGGDIIEVETARAFDGLSLESQPRVRRVTQTSPRTFRVVVDEAGTATPAVMATIAESGGEVVSSREYRLTFDEIFAELVERNRRRLEEEESEAARHDRNEADARVLVERELEQRRRDSATASLDDAAEARTPAETRSPAAHPDTPREARMAGSDRPSEPAVDDGRPRGAGPADAPASDHGRAVEEDVVTADALAAPEPVADGIVTEPTAPESPDRTDARRGDDPRDEETRR